MSLLRQEGEHAPGDQNVSRFVATLPFSTATRDPDAALRLSRASVADVWVIKLSLIRLVGCEIQAKYLALRLLEAWRNLSLSASAFLRLAEGSFQIRLDSS